MRKILYVAWTSLMVSIFLGACGPSQVGWNARATQIAAIIFSTQTAQVPTITNTPSPIPVFTILPYATPTPTITPTKKPIQKPPIGASEGDTWISPEDGMTLVYIPAGEFLMGSSYFDSESFNNEFPQHSVYLEAFWIDQTEVTNNMFTSFLTAMGNGEEGGVPWLDAKSTQTLISLEDREWKSKSGYGNHPATLVSWYGAKAHCQWVGRRLPTEAEWEKAARGPDERIYPWGNDSPNYRLLNFNNIVQDTTPVGNYPKGSSYYGVLDMAGNVNEWTSSLYLPYPYQATDGREDLSVSDLRVVRGGSFIGRGMFIRSAFRINFDPILRTYSIGFRCALSQD